MATVAIGFFTSSSQLAEALGIPCGQSMIVLLMSSLPRRLWYVYTPTVYCPGETLHKLAKLLQPDWNQIKMATFLLCIAGCRTPFIYSSFATFEWAEPDNGTRNSWVRMVDIPKENIIIPADVLPMFHHSSWTTKDLMLLQQYAKRLQCRWGIPQVIACASDADWVTKEEHSYLLGLTIFHRGKSLGFQICDGRGPYRVNLKLHLRIPSCPGKVLVIHSTLESYNVEVMQHSFCWIVTVKIPDENVAALFGIPTTATELLKRSKFEEYQDRSDFLDGKLMNSIVRALGMKEEGERSSCAILRFILLFLQTGVPTYFQYYTCSYSNMKRMIQPENRIMWQVPMFADDLECNPGSLFDALQ